jgi:polyisoprenoid-binding protein YceI
MRRFVLAMSFALAATSVAAQTKPTSTMQLDSDHASITAGVGGSKSRFAVTAGALEYDSARPERSTLALSLDTTSLADQRARTAFDADKFPELRIASTGIGKKSGNAETLATDVTIHDVTRPVVFQITLQAVSAGLVNLHAEATVHGADFHLGGKSGDVAIVIDAPFNAVQATRALP